MNIAILEDNAIISLFIKDTLEDLGHNVLGRFDEAEPLLNFVNKVPIDLIFTDIEIKGSMDGVRCAIKLQNDFSIPSIFVTSYQDSKTISDATDALPLGYLVKPINHHDISTAIMIASKAIKNNKYKKSICVGGYEYDLETKTLTFNKTAILLSDDEYKIVQLLFSSCGSTVPMQKILNCISNKQNNQDYSIKNLINNLREKIPELSIMYSLNIGYCVECNV